MELLDGRGERRNARSMGEPRQQPYGAGTLWEGSWTGLNRARLCASQQGHVGGNPAV